MTDITPLSGDELNKLVDDFEASEHNRMAMNAVTAGGRGKGGGNPPASTRWRATTIAPV